VNLYEAEETLDSELSKIRDKLLQSFVNAFRKEGPRPGNKGDITTIPTIPWVSVQINWLAIPMRPIFRFIPELLSIPSSRIRAPQRESQCISRDVYV
jgi:hypothetical protein